MLILTENQSHVFPITVGFKLFSHSRQTILLYLRISEVDEEVLPKRLSEGKKTFYTKKQKQQINKNKTRTTHSVTTADCKIHRN